MRINLPPRVAKRTGLAKWVFNADPEQLAVLGIGAVGASWLAISLIVTVIFPLMVIRFIWILGDLVQNNWNLPPNYSSYKEYFMVLFIPFSKYPYRAIAWAFSLVLRSPKVRKKLKTAPKQVRTELQVLSKDLQFKAISSPMPTASEIQRARDRALIQLNRGSPKAYRAFQRLDKQLECLPR